MSAVTSKVQICNLALSGPLGNRNTVMNIDTPKSDKEIVFAQWYDVVRQMVLKTMMPNFALYRLTVSQVTPPDGYATSYSYAYEYPNRCLKLLGIGDIDATDTPPYAVENGMIFTNLEYTDGMPIRIIDDVTDVSRFSADFVIQFAYELGKYTGLALTQDINKKKEAQKDAQIYGANSSALNAQENKPIRRSVSRFRQARDYNVPMNPSKP